MISKNTLIVVFSALILASCGNSSDNKASSDEVDISIAGDYKVDSIETSLLWTGKKLASSHQGVVKIQKGNLKVVNGRLLSGDIIINMTSIEVKNEENETKNKLQNHLRESDFFDVEKYPVAVLKIISFENGQINADLTIKDKTKNIIFPAQIQISEEEIIGSAQFSINRTDWGIIYGSSTYLDVVKDKIISDNIDFKVSLKAKKEN